MMKDRYLKQQMIQYFLAQEWYPQLEVNVIYNESISVNPKLLTDIDVFALASQCNGVLTPIIGDCKTLKNQSPINRVFWLKGLMELFRASSGIIVLSKKIEGEHKLLANKINVSLLSEEDFKTYSSAMASENLGISALSNIELWERYFELPKSYPQLETLCSYCRMGFWNEFDFNIKLRHSIAKLRDVRRELNPDQMTHIFLLLELASLFAISLNELTMRIFNDFLLPKDKEVFDRELKVLLWGGYENYIYWNEMRNRLTANSNGEIGDLTLPMWPSFVQLVRSCLDKPLSTATTPLILKELAFQHLIEQQSFVNDESYLRKLALKDPHAAKNAIIIIDYLVKSAKLPREFSDIPSSLLMKVQRT